MLKSLLVKKLEDGRSDLLLVVLLALRPQVLELVHLVSQVEGLLCISLMVFTDRSEVNTLLDIVFLADNCDLRHQALWLAPLWNGRAFIQETELWSLRESLVDWQPRLLVEFLIFRNWPLCFSIYSGHWASNLVPAVKQLLIFSCDHFFYRAYTWQLFIVVKYLALRLLLVTICDVANRFFELLAFVQVARLNEHLL